MVDTQAQIKRREPLLAAGAVSSIIPAWATWVATTELLCLPPSLVVFRTSDGRTFALNGAAGSRYPSIEPIWARDEKLSKLTGEDMRVSIGPLIAKGLGLCGR